MDLAQIARAIPEYDHFLTIDELNASTHQLVADYPELASMRVVGTTRGDDPIELLTIRGGEKQAFVFGGPHPNEPIGTLTIEYLARRLCEDDALRAELGYTWHFIKSIDSDGMRLNEGWFKGPFTPSNYARHFFRPAPFDQIEWTFPIDYKDLHFHSPLPETQALMDVIDEIKPDLLYSLHNAGFGGVYYYVSEPCPPLYDIFSQIPTWYDLALDLGEPEVPYVDEYAPAIFGMIYTSKAYDYLEQNGVPNPAETMQSGTSSADYASKYGSFFLVTELPYYDDPRVNDQSLSDTQRRDAILQGLDYADEFDDWVRTELERVRGDLKIETPFHRAVTAFSRSGKAQRDAERQWALTSEDTARPAKQAELFSNLLGSRFYRLLIFGMFVRMMEAEIAAGNDSLLVKEVQQKALKRLEEQGSDLESGLNYRALPIRSLVGVQVCAGLATAVYVRDRQKE
ncbi:MAG: zinc carboxypeptidase [Chloroflexi bacterium]|nr:zinc carboxypeptidase [Chloroflexota bacterium]